MEGILGIAYILLAAGILAINMQRSLAPSDRLLATLQTLLLMIPTVVVYRMYLRVREQAEQYREKEKMAEDAPQQKPSGEKRTDYQQFEAHILPAQLTEREKEVAWLLYRGFTNRQIGEELCIAETTVKKHVSHIFEKMQIQSRKELREKVEMEKIMPEET